MRVPQKQLAVLISTFGVVLLVLRVDASEETGGRTSCSEWDDSRSCALLPENRADSAVVLSHSLLQVSKPPKSSSKVRLSKVHDESSQLPSKHHASQRKTASDLHKAQQDENALEPDLSATATGALAFIQTGEIVEPEGVSVSESSSQEAASESKSSLAASPAEEVHMTRQRGFVDAAVLGGAVCLVCLIAWSVCLGRSCFSKVARISQAWQPGTIELPKPEPTSALSPGAFKEPLLPQTEASFVIPLTLHTEMGSANAFCFKIPRHPSGPALSARVKCQPEGNTWAKVQLFWDEGDDVSSPLASCCLVHSASDVESRNIQGAMMSWLSLLLHEKEDAEVAAVERTPMGDHGSTGPQQSRVRACLHGIAEDLFAAGSASSSLGSMRLEVRDGFGVLAGYLEPASKHGWYVLTCQGETALDIEARPDRSLALSKKGTVIALARHLGSPRSPELPEVTGEEEEHLQVDIGEGVAWPEQILLLTCVLTMIVFKPKATSQSNEIELNAEKSLSAEALIVTSPDDGPHKVH